MFKLVVFVLFLVHSTTVAVMPNKLIPGTYSYSFVRVDAVKLTVTYKCPEKALVHLVITGTSFVVVENGPDIEIVHDFNVTTGNGEYIIIMFMPVFYPTWLTMNYKRQFYGYSLPIEDNVSMKQLPDQTFETSFGENFTYTSSIAKPFNWTMGFQQSSHLRTEVLFFGIDPNSPDKLTEHHWSDDDDLLSNYTTNTTDVLSTTSGVAHFHGQRGLLMLLTTENMINMGYISVQVINVFEESMDGPFPDDFLHFISGSSYCNRWVMCGLLTIAVGHNIKRIELSKHGQNLISPSVVIKDEWFNLASFQIQIDEHTVRPATEQLITNSHFYNLRVENKNHDVFSKEYEVKIYNY